MVFRNSAAHLVARILSLIAGLVAIPLVSIMLGGEALGLVGVYLTLQGIFGLLDLGLSATVNQQLATSLGRDGSPTERAELVRSLEIVFWLMALIFLGGGWFASDLIANSWLKIEAMPSVVANQALSLIVAGVAIRFPIGFYSNVHFGLDRHVYPNAVIALSALARIVVPVLALTQFGIGIAGYFLILLLLNAMELALLLAGAWYRVSHLWIAPRWGRLTEVFHAAGLLWLVTIVSMIATHIDKLLLSSQLSLSDFGIYTAAYAMAGGLLAISYPVSNALFPQMVQQLDQQRDARVKTAIRTGTELTILFILPIGAVMVTQPSAILDALFVLKQTPPGLDQILPLMMAGAIAQGFVTLPHMFQIAALRTKYVLWLNAAMIVPYAIVMLMAARHYGVWGAAVVFAAFNLVHLSGHWLMLLMNARSSAIWRSIPPLVIASCAGSFILAGLATVYSVPKPLNAIVAIILIAAIALAALLTLPGLRTSVLSRLLRRP